MIKMKGIVKRFGSLVANDHVDFQVNKGEIHALLGENGAGKSTLMSILFGLYEPDEGEIWINDQKVQIRNPNDANKYGIGMVHQHFKLVEVFTVLENIILGAEDTIRGFLTTKDARKIISELMDKYDLYVNLDTLVKDLTVGQQQKVEIIKMLYRKSDILIFDEPTAVLTPQETHDLIKIMKNFAKEGKTIILITHKLNEIKEAASRSTILRRGKNVKTIIVSKTSTKVMAEMMVGRPIIETYEKDLYQPKQTILKVDDLCVPGGYDFLVNHVSFEVKSGEIVGIAGIDGNGQSQLIQAITGLIHVNNGTILINNVDVTKQSIRKKIEKGISHIPEDRHRHGLVLDFNLAENLILETYYQASFQKRGWLNHQAIFDYAKKLIKNYDIRSANDEYSLMRSMSGGNQQKAIIAREVEKEHELLIAVQPTRGLDVGAIEYIHSQLIKERDSGKAVLLVSFELEEILSLSDRILVMYEGSIKGSFMTNEIDVNELGLYMSGSRGKVNG